MKKNLLITLAAIAVVIAIAILSRRKRPGLSLQGATRKLGAAVPMLYASGSDKKLYRLEPAGWQLVGPCCVTYIAFNPVDKRIYGVGETGLIKSIVPSPYSSWFRSFYDNDQYNALSVAFDAGGVPYHVGPTDHKVYKKLPGGVFSGWEEYPNSCCINSITFGPSNEMLGINSAGDVYKHTGGKWEGPIAAMSMPNLRGLTYSSATKSYYALSSRGQVLAMPTGGASAGKWAPLAPESPVPLTSVTVAS